jgi:hypothetical protein
MVSESTPGLNCRMISSRFAPLQAKLWRVDMQMQAEVQFSRIAKHPGAWMPWRIGG